MRKMTMLQKLINISKETLNSLYCIFVSNCLKNHISIKLYILNKICNSSAITLPHSKQIMWYFIRQRILITYYAVIVQRQTINFTNTFDVLQ